MLKEIIEGKILSKHKKRSNGSPKVRKDSPVKKEELITPLLYISRGSNNRFSSMQRPQTQCDIFKTPRNKNSKLSENFQFTNLRNLVNPLRTGKNLDNLITRQTLSTIRTKPIKRRRSLFKYLHSEKQVPRLKLSKN